MDQDEANARGFIDKVVLVTSFATQSVANFMLDRDPSLIDRMFVDETRDDLIMSEIGKTLITANGTVGAHLNFDSSLLNPNFVNRPHSHWSWNELVHPNGPELVNTWEASIVACLDPLESFKNVFGCSSYDTLVLGSHQLSQKSVILVPEKYSRDVATRLLAGGYTGTVIGYDPQQLTMRQAITKTMDAIYPQAFKLLNTKGIRTAILTGTEQDEHGNDPDYDPESGHFNRLLVQGSSGNSAVVFEENGKPRLSEYIQYAQGRHAGLHNGAITDIENVPLAKYLENMSNNPATEINKHKNFLITGTGDLDRTVTYWANDLRHRINKLRYKPDTGIENFAAYVMKKALISEFRLLIPELCLPKSTGLLKTLIDNSYADICQHLDTIGKVTSVNTAEWRDQFCTFLEAQWKSTLKIAVRQHFRL
jgi:hypothetical protein